MEPAPQGGSRTGKTIAAVLLIGLGLSGLAMSLGGGFFTGMSLYEWVGGKATGEAREWIVLFFVVGGFSFVVGMLAMFLTVVVWKRVMRT